MSATRTAPQTPFQRVLIANRGEIALRIIRTARAMGLETVAVCSNADRDALHVRAADQSIVIGGTIARQSYLKMDAILAAARASGADAVHPGYGFLAENADFARACADAGLVFIGPSADAILAMGDKAAAKAAMLDAGVPCVPGYQGEDQDDDRLLTEAVGIGFPVMIKAVAGGGGRGMRLVPDAESFPELLRSARSEAKGAFGNGDVLLERAIIEPRHVEIQVFGDRFGNAIHLGERDCSVQRRHQKVIEEAPCPVLAPDTRRRMGEAAVAAVKALSYEGAGTLEFLLDATGEFYFMEMNTRLQVEHPVTEMITGLDLVELQLRVAAGEPLPIGQADVRFSGHAIEVRLCAEDEARDFLPQAGRVDVWQAPADIRVESAVAAGSAVPPYYDSMIAKLVAHGEDREVARRRLLHGLGELRVTGIATNRDFLRRCLRHPVFAAGEATTGFIAAHRDALGAPNDWDEVEVAIAALALRTVSTAGLEHDFPVALRLKLNGKVFDSVLTRQGAGRYEVAVGDWRGLFSARAVREGLEVEHNGRLTSIAPLRSGDQIHLDLRGENVVIEDCSLQPAKADADTVFDGTLRASMGGRVTALPVAPGEVVEAGSALLVLEAMKMEHVHRARADGVVAAIRVAVGDHVPQGAILIEFEQAGAKE